MRHLTGIRDGVLVRKETRLWLDTAEGAASWQRQEMAGFERGAVAMEHGHTDTPHRYDGRLVRGRGGGRLRPLAVAVCGRPP